MPDDVDEDLEVWDQFVTAVRDLSQNSRPGLSLALATQEALTAWVSEQSALAHGGVPFGPSWETLGRSTLATGGAVPRCAPGPDLSASACSYAKRPPRALGVGGRLHRGPGGPADTTYAIRRGATLRDALSHGGQTVVATGPLARRR